MASSAKIQPQTSLYGIKTEDDCRARLDELLETHRLAKEAMNKEMIGRLNAILEKYYKLGNTRKAENKMSDDERAYFWPAIQEAYAFRPNLARPATWREGLDEVEWKLQKNRPK